MLHCWNGPNRAVLLGDMMGIGKTIDTIVACVLDKDRVRGAFDLIVTTKTCTNSGDKRSASIPTMSVSWRSPPHVTFSLIITPRVISRLSLPSTKTNTRPMNLLGRYDFVICSYRFVQTQFSKMKKFDTECKLAGKYGLDQAVKHKIRMPTSPLFSEIYRKLDMPIRHLILDEVQFVKNTDTVTKQSRPCPTVVSACFLEPSSPIAGLTYSVLSTPSLVIQSPHSTTS